MCGISIAYVGARNCVLADGQQNIRTGNRRTKVVNKISDNTLGILEHHLFCYNVLNLLFWGISLLDKSGTIVFDVEMFQSWAVYRYEPFKQFGVFYIIVGIAGSLLIVSGTERIKKSLPGRKSEHNKLKKL